jgi:hypothetical protein
MNSSKKMQRLFAVMAVFGLVMGGCAATNGALTTQKISQGEKGIREAKETNAGQNAPAELNVAEGKLGQAKEALGKKDYKNAARLVEQAQVDADYARAKAASQKAKENNEETQKNIAALRQEIERLSKK